MHIFWLGETGIKIETKNGEEAVVILIDPYINAAGSSPRSIKADLILYSKGDKDSITTTGTPFVMQSPGEIETKNVLIYAVPGQYGVLWFFESEGITLAHVGACGRGLTDKQLEILSGADILFVPVGGGGGRVEEKKNKGELNGGTGVGTFANAEEAAKIVTSVEPRVAIPIAHGTLKGEKMASVKEFLKEMGVENGAPEAKLKIQKKDLPQDEMKVVVLERE